MIELFSEEVRRNPYPLYDRVRAASPVLREPRSDCWMIFDYEGVKRALSEPEVFSSRAAPPGGMPLDWLIFLDAPRHAKLRALVLKAFTPGVVARLEPRIRELSRELLDRQMERGEMDVAGDYAVPLPMMVIAELIGIPREEWPRFRRWSDGIMNLGNTVTGGEAATRAFQEAGAVKAEMHAYLMGLLAQRSSGPREGLLARLAEAEVDGERLTPAEILGFFQLLLAAGTETTTNLIGNALLCWMEDREQLARLRAAPELLPLAIEEVLRYRSPVQTVFRTTKRDVEVHGQTIPAGKLVLVMIGSANRDPRQFREAERFDIGREPNPHLAFGQGVHFCLGAALSRLEGRIALGDLLERLEEFELASTEPWPPRQAFHVHGPTRLPIRFSRGRSAPGKTGAPG